MAPDKGDAQDIRQRPMRSEHSPLRQISKVATVRFWYRILGISTLFRSRAVSNVDGRKPPETSARRASRPNLPSREKLRLKVRAPADMPAGARQTPAARCWEPDLAPAGPADFVDDDGVSAALGFSAGESRLTICCI